MTEITASCRPNCPMNTKSTLRSLIAITCALIPCATASAILQDTKPAAQQRHAQIWMRFDANQDGRLDDAEKQAARDSIRSRIQGRRTTAKGAPQEGQAQPEPQGLAEGQGQLRERLMKRRAVQGGEGGAKQEKNRGRSIFGQRPQGRMGSGQRGTSQRGMQSGRLGEGMRERIRAKLEQVKKQGGKERERAAEKENRFDRKAKAGRRSGSHRKGTAGKRNGGACDGAGAQHARGKGGRKRASSDKGKTPRF
ncbi:MAG: hypothetical protein ACI841_000826 [Planctomycetota bacterium]|jgi:hypothetical protein